MPDVFAFNGTLFGWGGTDGDAKAAASGTFKWAPTLPASATKGTAKLKVGQSVVFAFAPVAGDQSQLDTSRIGLWVGDVATQIEVTTEESGDDFQFLSDGTVLVRISDTTMAELPVGRHSLEFWNLDTDEPISTGTVTIIDSIRP